MSKTVFISAIITIYATISFSQKPIQPLLDTLELIIQEKNIPGAMISIVTSDSILFAGGIGYADVDKLERTDAEHLFRIGSISKGFTALAILKLESEGKLSLQDPIMKIDPDAPVKNKWHDESPILIENILEHTAGFDDMHMHAVYNKIDSLPPSSDKSVFRDRKSLYARWEPGVRMSYSNPGYTLAGHVIEKVSGKPHFDYIKEAILDPIGMKNSAFYFKSPLNEKMAKGYRYEGGKWNQEEYIPINGGAAGAMCSNAKEMASYLQFALNRTNDAGNEIIPSVKFDRFENSKTTIAAKNGFEGGYGLGNRNLWKSGHLFHGHNGGIDGFASDHLYSRTADLGIAISINTMANTRQMINTIVDYLLEKHEKKPGINYVSIPNEIKEKYQGYYQFKSPRTQLTAPITGLVDGVKLKIDTDQIRVVDPFGNEKEKWRYAEDGNFYAENEGLPVAKLLDHKGKEVLWLWNDYAEKDSYLKRMTTFVLLAFSALAVVCFIIIGAIILVFYWYKKKKQNSLELLPIWLACLNFIALPFFMGLSSETMRSEGALNIFTICLFVFSIVFVGSAGYALHRSWNFQKIKGFNNFYAKGVALGLVYLALFMLINGYVGLRLWAY